MLNDDVIFEKKLMGNLDFTENVVRYNNGNITLAGALMLPEGDSLPGAVFIHGSGNSDRTNPWYQEIAKHLANHGIAVLLPDKRGCHESEGDWRKADFDDLASDAIAGVEALRAQKSVSPRLVGLIGVSQGGWIAPNAVAIGEVAFVVSLSGAAVMPIEQFRHEVTQDLRQKGLPTALVHIYFPFAQLLLRRKWPRWKDIKDFNPIPLWEKLQVPGLLVFGELDEHDNVPVLESLRRLKPIIKRKRPTEFLVKVFKGSGHGLRETGSKQIRQDFLNQLTEWINAKKHQD